MGLNKESSHSAILTIVPPDCQRRIYWYQGSCKTKRVPTLAPKAPPCHSERSEESRPSPPKSHLSLWQYGANGAVEKGNIPVEDEILHCVQNDKVGT
ncbi:MAG TPA: hypothetical protein VGE04_15825, partial [Chloroflexia bacterium]